LTHSILVVLVLFLKFFNPFLEKRTRHFETEKTSDIICASKKNACMDLDEMLRVDRCRDMDELINCPIRILVRIQELDLHRIFTTRRVCVARIMHAVARCMSVRPSLRLSVRHTPVLSVNGYTYPQRLASPFTAH